MTTLTAEELLAGSSLTHHIEVPAGLLHENGAPDPAEMHVVLRPLTVQALQRIGKAAREDEKEGDEVFTTGELALTFRKARRQDAVDDGGGKAQAEKTAEKIIGAGLGAGQWEGACGESEPQKEHTDELGRLTELWQ